MRNFLRAHAAESHDGLHRKRKDRNHVLEVRKRIRAEATRVGAMDAPRRRKLLGLFSWVIASVLLTGCAGSWAENLRQASVGRVACPPDEIQIRDIRSGFEEPTTWTASCRGRAWYCASHPTKCTRADQAQTAVPAAKVRPTVTHQVEGLTVEYDEFEKHTTLRARLVTTRTTTTFSGQPAKVADRIRITVFRNLGAPIAYDACRNMDLSIEGKVIAASPSDVMYTAGGGPVPESLSVVVPLATVTAMAETTTATKAIELDREDGRALAAVVAMEETNAAPKIRACNDVIAISAKQRLLLKSFLVRWKGLAARAPKQESAPAQASPAEPPGEVTPLAPVSADGIDSPVAAGCQYDTQCKGERICAAGQCVDPPAPPAVAAPAAPGK